MRERLNSILDVVLDNPPSALIGALMFALIVSMAISIVYGRWMRKWSDNPTALCSLVLVACVASMALAGSHVQRNWKTQHGGPAFTPSPGGPPPRGMGPGGGHAGGGVPAGFPRSIAHNGPPPGAWDAFLTEKFLQSADRNGDRKLSPEEASHAADLLVRIADRAEKGGVDARALHRALKDRLDPSHGHIAHTPVAETFGTTH